MMKKIAKIEYLSFEEITSKQNFILSFGETFLSEQKNTKLSLS